MAAAGIYSIKTGVEAC
ncbi:hypothetical protein VCHC56A2_0120, partial [Vibrio cholerae HC-56A2]